MEEYLGYIDGRPPNQKKSYCAITASLTAIMHWIKDGKSTHTNAQMTALAVKELFKDNPGKIKGN